MSVEADLVLSYLKEGPVTEDCIKLRMAKYPKAAINELRRKGHVITEEECVVNKAYGDLYTTRYKLVR